MPTNFDCPACKRTLEISDELVGKRIKCPACKTIFTATIGGTPSPTQEPSPRRSPSPQAKSEDEVRIPRKAPSAPPEEEFDEEEQEEETTRVRKRPIRQRDEDREEEDEEEEEEEELPRRRRRSFSSSRQRARSIALAPAISLIVVGGLSILSSILATIGSFLGDNPPVGGFIPIVVAITISQVCMGAATIVGAFHFKNLTSYGYATTASILAMLPCTFCFVAGLPVGVWSLIVINRSDVKPYFRPPQ